MKVGITFGGYCPMHTGHLDLIMKAKKENDICYVVVCGYDNEPRADEIGLTLKRRYSLVKQMFKNDEQIRVLMVNDTELGIDESMSESNWDIWLHCVEDQVEALEEKIADEMIGLTEYTWYVGEQSYVDSLKKRIYDRHKDNTFGIVDNIIYVERSKNPISATMIRENPVKYWNKIAWPFRQYFSTNILITGTASEGKSTLTRDIATYFGIPYSEEYGRTYMEYYGKDDTDLTVTDFQQFLIEQRRDTQKKIESPGNCGVVISDTDNIVTLMYAKAYVEDNNIDLTEEDYKTLEQLAWNIKRGIQWDRIFLLPPKNKFVDDGCRYMVQSSMEERMKNYDRLVELLKQFGWWDKVVILNGTFLENFNKVKDYINTKMNPDE
jgi:NadR type nicotinamide-nucleotide adenylyltransferase